MDLQQFFKSGCPFLQSMSSKDRRRLPWFFPSSVAGFDRSLSVVAVMVFNSPSVSFPQFIWLSCHVSHLPTSCCSTTAQVFGAEGPDQVSGYTRSEPTWYHPIDSRLLLPCSGTNRKFGFFILRLAAHCLF